MSNQKVLSATTWTELLIGVALVSLFIYSREDLDKWVRGVMPASALSSAHAGCNPPSTEHEQLHVVLGWRDGKIVHIGCQYVGSQSAYVKDRRW